MSEVKYEDEKKLLTSDEFIAAAKQNADKNLQIQKDTAQKVYDSTYASLDRQYNEAAAAAGVAKERNLIDADTAYQRQEMKYGAEQEALAAAGLSGSGMNEYRRAQSYQKNREDRQMSYAEYDRALREANYARDQGKLTADLNKAQSDAAAEMHYNDTMTGIAEKELGYAELERQEISAAYGSYINGINDGSMTLDQIKADASWAKLSPDQQKAVENTAKVKGIKTKIDNGESWEDIQKSYAYLELDEDGRNQVDGYHAQVVAGKTKDANAALGSYLEMAKAGWSIDSIKAVAEANGHYSVLSESNAWESVVAETDAYAAGVEKGESADQDANYLGLLTDINSGALTIDAIKNTSVWRTLTPQQQVQLESAAALKGKTEMKDRMGVYENLAANGTSLEDIKTMMAINGDKYVEELTPEEYEKLSDEEKAEYNEARNFMKLIESSAGKYAEDKAAAELKEQNYINDSNFASWLSAIGSGALTLADAQSMSGYGSLSTAQQAQLESAAQKYASDKAAADAEKAAAELKEQNYINDSNFASWLSAIGSGALTLADAQAMSGYGSLSAAQQAQLESAAQAYSDAQEALNSEDVKNRVLGYADLAAKGYGIDDIKDMMALYGDTYISAEDYEKYSDDNKEKYAEVRKHSAVIDNAVERYTSAQSAIESGDRANQIAGLADLAATGMSMDEIKQWAEIYGITDLGDNEIAVIQNAVDRYTAAQSAIESENERERAYGYAGLIEAGWSLDDVKALIGADEYEKLSPETKRIIETTASVISKAKTETANKEASAALTDYIEFAMKGVSIGTIEAIARANGHYDELAKAAEGETSFWQSVIDKATAFENAQTKSETQTNIENAIADGATLEEIESMPGYDELDPEVQEQIGEQVEDRDEEKKTQSEAISAGLRNAGYTSASEVEDYLASDGVPESERAEYVAQWQSDNSKRVMDTIKLDIFEVDVETLVDGLKHGAYGDQAQAIADAYYKAAVDKLYKSGTTLGDIADLMDAVAAMPSNLMGIKTSTFRQIVSERVVVRTKSGQPTTSTEGKAIKIGSAITDPEAVSTLDAFQNNYIEYGGYIYWKSTNGKWYEMTYDYSGASGASNGASSNGTVGSQGSNGLDRAPNGKR